MRVRQAVVLFAVLLALAPFLPGQVGPVRLLIVPAGPTTVHAGSNLQLNVYEYYFSNTTHTTGVRDLTQQVTYISSDFNVATTTSLGVIRPVGGGTTTITAISGPFRTSIKLTVIGLTSIAVTPNNNPTVPQGDVQQFTATGMYTDSTSADITKAVTWNSDTPAVFPISNAIGSQGVATAVASAGTVNISASLGSVSSPAVQVTAGPPALEFITVEPANAHVNVSASFAFTANGHYSNGSTQAITNSVAWVSLQPGTATINSATGVASGVSLGVATITATQGSITGSTSLNVALQQITVTCDATGPLPKGDTRQCHAIGRFNSGGPDTNTEITNSVTWFSSAPVAATVNQSGLVTAVNANLGTNICAASPPGPLQTCISIGTTLARLVSITISGPSALSFGASAQYTATGFFADGSQQNVTNFVAWTSATPTVAVISNNGGNHGFLQTGLNFQNPGTSNIQASFTPASLPTVFSNTIALTVSPKTLASITLAPVNPIIAVNSTLQFAATPHYSDGSTTPAITPAWSSSAPSVATVNGAGLATGVFPGMTTIRATSGSVSGSTTLNITGTVLTSITVTPANMTIAQGATQQYTATGHFSDGSTLDITNTVTWTSTSTSFATISASGLATGVGAGSTTIRATDPATTTIAGSTNLTVTAVTLQSITILPNPGTVTAGITQQFIATGHYSDNSTQDITAIVTWSSSDPDTATINTAGLATGVSPGVTIISVTLGSINGTSPLNVTGATLISITVTPANPTIQVNTQLQFTATGSYSDGSTQNLTSDPAISWSSSPTFVATISNTGWASAQKGPGITTITATLSGVSGSTQLTTTF